MYILAFETSCDDTSVALMKDWELVTMSTRTQLEHTETGWVVPEVAARSHANAIFPCIDDVLSKAGVQLSEVNFIACTEKPWLLPSLLTGMTVAKTLSLSLNKPILWIDHIESHIFANFLERKESDISFPSLVLTVSGGHTEIYLWKSMFVFQILGQTRDDSVWEAFDKVSKMMWLGFPGGAIISARAAEYRKENPSAILSKRLFPEVLLESGSLDFSFSGIKTAVKREVDKEMQLSWGLSDDFRSRIAFEFEETATDILQKKIFRAYQSYPVKTIILSGWVSANSILRTKIQKWAEDLWIAFLAPVKNIYSMDNAAMVGIRAYYQIIKW